MPQNRRILHIVRLKVIKIKNISIDFMRRIGYNMIKMREMNQREVFI